MSAPLGAFAHHMNHTLQQINTRLYRIATLFACIMPIPITIDVILRLFSDYSVFGVIEIEEICMLILVYCSLASLQQKKDHIRIDLINNFVSASSLKTLELFTSLVSLGFFSFITYCTLISLGNKWNELSLVFGLPMPLFVGMTTVGFGMLALVLLSQCLCLLLDECAQGKYAGALTACLAAAALVATPFWMRAFDLVPGRFVLGCQGMAVMLLLLLLRMPLGFAMGSVGAVGLLLLLPSPQAAFSMLGSSAINSTATFTLAVIPLFILMGALCFRSGISNDLFSAAHAWCGRLPGGMAISSVVGCAGFAAVCGDSMATAVTMGTVALPEMREKKYAPGLACGSLAAGGTLGILIPPSIGFIFYAIITEESVGKLFAAGVIPGIALTGIFSLQIILTSLLHPERAPRGEKTSMKEKLLSLRGTVFMLIIFVLILGGIFSGWFSPTEGGAIGAAGAAGIALLRRRLSRADFIGSLEECVTFSSKLLVILFGVGILGNFLAMTRLPYTLADIITGWNLSQYAFLVALIVLFLALGCVMNVIPMLLLTMPSLYPSVVKLGFDPIWFGVVSVLVMEMGQITPPVGVNVFAISSVARDVPLPVIFRGVLPFVLSMLLMVLLLVLFPQLALWLPDLLFA